MTRCTIVLSLLFAAGTVTAQEVPTDTPVGDAWEAGDWERAVGILERAVSTEAATVDDWYRLGVARALNGNAAGAAEAFRRVRQLAPAFPGIEGDISAAEARAAHDASEAIDAPGVLDDAAARAIARSEELADGWWLSGARLELVSSLAEAPAADVRSWALEGDAQASAQAAEAALGAEPDDPARYASVARAWVRAGDIDRARYYLDLYETLGGDPASATDLYETLRGAR